MGSLLDRGFSISTLTGKGGEGKSYVTVQELAEHRMVRQNYHLITNLPLHLDEFCEHVAKRRKCDPDEVRDRIHIIPNETLERWRKGESGPWDLCDGLEHPTDLVIDEAHEFCSGADEHWRSFLGEARHRNLKRIMFLTQSVKKVSPEIDKHAKIRLRIEKGDTRRTKYFSVPMGDIYQVLGSLLGVYTPLVFRIEEVQNAQEKWVAQHEDLFKFSAKVFSLYDTHSEAGGSSEAGDSQVDPEEFERRPRLLWGKRDYNDTGVTVWTAPTWAWFIASNFEATLKVVGITVLLSFLCFGGMGWVVQQWSLKSQAVLKSAFKTNRRIHTDKRPSGATSQVTADGDGDCGCDGKQERIRVGQLLIQDLAAEIKKARGEGDLAAVVTALAPRFVKFGGGELVYLNETIQGGPHDGQVLKQIDFRGRRVLFGDGEWVRLQIGGEVGEEDAPASIRDLLQRAERATETEAAMDEGGRSVEWHLVLRNLLADIGIHKKAPLA